jgi:molybdenum cofactor biosynthesis enzyme
MAEKKSKSRRLTDQAFAEVPYKTPAVVKQTAKKKGNAAAKKQMAAIALDKARRAGARIPKKKTA